MPLKSILSLYQNAIAKKSACEKVQNATAKNSRFSNSKIDEA